MKSRNIIIETEREVITIARGCPADFWENLTQYHNALLNYLNIEDEKLDCSLESLKILDSLLREVSPQEEVPLPVFYGLLGYCGEIIKEQTGGEWALYKGKHLHELSKDDAMHYRYFPIIKGKNNEYDYYGEVDFNLEDLSNCNLYQSISQVIAATPPLPVAKVNPNDWFLNEPGGLFLPPLDDKDQ